MWDVSQNTEMPLSSRAQRSEPCVYFCAELAVIVIFLKVENDYFRAIEGYLHVELLPGACCLWFPLSNKGLFFFTINWNKYVHKDQDGSKLNAFTLLKMLHWKNFMILQPQQTYLSILLSQFAPEGLLDEGWRQ